MLITALFWGVSLFLAPPKITAATVSNQAAFEAYKTFLTEHKEQIDAYYWQNGYYSPWDELTDDNIATPVAFADIYGDSTPEMFLMMGDEWDENEANLHIYSYDSGSLCELFESYGVDSTYGGGFSFSVFQTKDGRTYLRTWIGSSDWDWEEYSLLECAYDGYILQSDELMYNKIRSDDPYVFNYTYQSGDTMLSESEYNERKTSLKNSTSVVILETYGKDNISMTYDEAIEYADRGIAGLLLNEEAEDAEEDQHIAEGEDIIPYTTEESEEVSVWRRLFLALYDMIKKIFS